MSAPDNLGRTTNPPVFFPLRSGLRRIVPPEMQLEVDLSERLDAHDLIPTVDSMQGPMPVVETKQL